MEIQEKLFKFKFHILLALTSSFVIVFLCYLAPSIIDILKYLWPLLISTVLFLVTVVIFDRISPPVVESTGEIAGEGLLDYVAGQPPFEQESLGEVAEVEESVKAE